MKRTLLIIVALLALVAFAVPASAQPLVNPGQVVFTVSTDHAQVTKYVLGFFAAGATTPARTVDLGTGTPNAQNELTFAINVSPLTFGAGYTGKVQAVAGTVSSEWSDPSNPFDRAPGKSGTPIVKK